jgi:hypothetical protein
MGSIIFIHGTGVREDSYKKSLSRVGEKFFSKRADYTLIPCFWGGKFGANAGRKLRSVPDSDTSRSPDSLKDEEFDVGTWGLLYDDPLFELRVLGLQAKPFGAAAPNQLAPSQQLEGAVKNVKIEGELETLLHDCGLDAIWEEAVGVVVTSKDYNAALTNAPAATNEYREAIARAFVAQAVWIVRDRQKLSDEVSPIRALDRDRLIELLLTQMKGARSARGWLVKQVIGRPATFFIRRNRAKYSESAYQGVGDILLYQAHGKAIQQFIREKIKDAKPPVVLLAHSLGGIACVDLLIEEALPEVKLLITAGSQSPLFYEMGALRSLAAGKPLPDHFPRHWLNIYDPSDFLGYVAKPVFPENPERTITDVSVNNREPFPQSHTTYFDNDQVWTAIANKLDQELI